MDLWVQPERPYLLFAGCKYYVRPKMAQIVDILLKAKGRYVPKAKLLAVFNPDSKTPGHVLNLYIYEIRKIIEPLGFVLYCSAQDGYVLYKDLAKKAA